ncbi:hypothetical protein B0F90DRAFT_1725595 [Multifurca ochricompacta]|uniref:Uncharacterized protein n=1 Tax=Multifurca ochricompacta TaxID=376703 RepID=A0AAD4M3P5_9AGAM|nr:hypothetical protein B0F90DRAFT_1725595 [Multifurca ochricompacta]
MLKNTMSSLAMITERPTLPSLRSLALPMHGVPSKMTSPSVHDLCKYRDQSDPWQGRRQEIYPHESSTPPPPSISGTLPSTPHDSVLPLPLPTYRGNPPDPSVRLVLTDSFENADAALVLCSAGASNTSNVPRMISSPDALGGIKPGAPLLVVGPALERIRRPGTALGKGARMHPYRIVHPTTLAPNSPVASGTHYPSRK